MPNMPLQRRRRGRPPGSKNKIMIKSIKTEEDEEIICNMCKKEFTSVSKLEFHKKQCKKNIFLHLQVKSKPKYFCKKCSKKFKLQSSYKMHLLNEHSETPGSVACKQCHVVCPNVEVLKTHVENTHERDTYECDYCAKKFARQAHVLRHMSQRGCDGRSKNNFPCEICNKVFSRKDNLMVHLRLNHISKKDFTCKHCSFATNNFSKLIRHVQVNHEEEPHFECDHCGKVTGSRAAIAKHLEIHGDKKYKCDVCGHNTFTIEVMRRHVLTHIPNKPHKCKICGNSYIQKLQLERHMVKHIGFTCFKCGQSFESKSKFLLHDKKHLERGKILCPFEKCEYATKELDNIMSYSEHIKKHLTDKLFVCNVCDKRFNCEAFLKRHVSTHALERPRRCMYCVNARAYVRGEQLVRHVRKAHPDVFRARLQHVRSVLGSNLTGQRVTKSEMESILNVLDAETDRILEDYGHGVLYGGLQEEASAEVENELPAENNGEESPLMSEEELVEHLKRLLSQLIESDVLEYFGWPDENVDTVLEKVIEKMGARAAPHDKWTRVQRLRENTKHLFLYAVEDKNIARMLDTHTIDQVVKHILAQVDTDAVKTEPEEAKSKKSP